MICISGTKDARAAALAEVVIVSATVFLLTFLVAAGPFRMKVAQRATCADNLRQISEAVGACFAENGDYGPTFDDGGSQTYPLIEFSLTWTDLLFDEGYLGHEMVRRCPVDERPDYPMKLRGQYWAFSFVERIGVNDPVKPGMRTSYALNYQMGRNFFEDRHPDASRQVYAMDGWWSWFCNVNAAWVLLEDVAGIQRSPMAFPSQYGTMHGWRHGAEYSANVLYRDGHVAALTPTVPADPYDLYTDTIDTTQVFTWLPGERDTRAHYDSYSGELPEYIGNEPYWTDPPDEMHKDVAGNKMPLDYPEELSCEWRTDNAAWVKFPNNPNDRQ